MEKSIEILKERFPEKKEELLNHLEGLKKCLQLEDDILKKDILTSIIAKDFKEVEKILSFLKIKDKTLEGISKFISLIRDDVITNDGKEDLTYMDFLCKMYEKEGIKLEK